MKIKKIYKTPSKIFYSDSIKSDFSKFHKYLNDLFSTWYTCPCTNAIRGIKSLNQWYRSTQPRSLWLVLCNIWNKVHNHNPYYIMAISGSTFFVCLITHSNCHTKFLWKDRDVRDFTISDCNSTRSPEGPK